MSIKLVLRPLLGRVALCAVMAAATRCALGAEASLGRGGAAVAADAPEAASHSAIEALMNYSADDAEKRKPLDAEAFAQTALTKQDAMAAQKLLWADHVRMIKATRVAEWKAREIDLGTKKMPFWYKIFGDKPKTGRSLFISMHGGGGAPAALNDSQYENQKRLYQPEEGVYLCPRAPTNTWNLWHEGHIDPMFSRIIEDLVVFEDVNPDRVYVMGYSAGGDGTFQLAPRMADRWAAASMMAGHPGDAAAISLRDLPFTIHVGALDAAYDRNKLAGVWEKKLDVLQKADPDGYEHWVKLHAGRPHWMNLEDKEAVPWMAKHTRNTFPKRVVWQQDDITHERFYWLAVSKENAKRGAVIVADRDGQTIKIESDVPHILVRLNDQMMDLEKPVTVTWNGKQVYSGTPKRTAGAIGKTIEERGDSASVFSAELDLAIPEGTKSSYVNPLDGTELDGKKPANPLDKKN